VTQAAAVSGDVFERRIRDAPFVERSVRAFVQGDQALGLGIRQRLQQHGVHHREHHRGGPGSERQREHRDEGKARTPPEHAQRISSVLPQVFEPAPRANVAALFLDQLGSTEREPRLASSLVRLDAVANQIGRMLFEMEAQLLVEQRIGIAAARP